MTMTTEMRLRPRDPHQPHRASTPLELMFDLASVIAVAATAHGLAHAVIEGHISHGLFGFLSGFFMIWWAWMNYTWFSSAYDDESTIYQALTMVVMFGALVMAAGLPAAFGPEPLWVSLLGFVIMRVGMAVFWLAAARGDPARRPSAMRYAVGILAVQVYWIAMALARPPSSAIYPLLFLIGALLEISVPAWAERSGRTSWHREHIMERYGLMNIIVLGECFVSVVAMIHLGATGALPQARDMGLAICAAVITFSLWMLYFNEEEENDAAESSHAFLWGYGHFALFAAGAAVGAGMTVMHHAAGGGEHVSARVAALSLALPVAVYVATLWFVRDRFILRGAAAWLLPMAVVAVLAVAVAVPAYGLPAVAWVMALTAIARRHLVRCTSRQR